MKTRHILTLLIVSSMNLLFAQRAKLSPGINPPQFNITIISNESSPTEYNVLGRNYKKIKDFNSLVKTYLKHSPETMIVIQTKSETSIHEIDKIINFLKETNAKEATILIDRGNPKNTQISINLKEPKFNITKLPEPPPPPTLPPN